MFRGKQITDGVWFEGGIETIINSKPYICTKAKYRNDTQDWGVAESNLNYLPARVEVIPETVGQYTGMFDKCGKKIFEGDIIARAIYDSRLNSIKKIHYGVFWNDEEKGFYVCGIGHTDIDYIGNFFESNIEVVGNIHDNNIGDFIHTKVDFGG